MTRTATAIETRPAAAARTSYVDDETTANGERRCSSCSQLRTIEDLADGVCVECREDAEDAAHLAPDLGENSSTHDVERALRRLAAALDSAIPFTPLGFAVISRKVLAWLAIVHAHLDLGALSGEMSHMAHMDENAVALSGFILCELEEPTFRGGRTIAEIDRIVQRTDRSRPRTGA